MIGWVPSRKTLPERAAVTERSVAKYRHRAFDWSNRSTCIHLARFHLRGMGWRCPPIPDFRSMIGARRALDAVGGITTVFDQLGMARIPPAMMLVGDVAVLPGHDGFDAILIGNGEMMIGWHVDDLSGLKSITDLDWSAMTAWRA